MTAAGSARDGWNIGAVLRQLRPEFPDVTISKIRFLESEGLIRPERTPAGYRRFTEDDVERLRFVLSAQRDHYLPLRVIKEQLDDADRDGLPRSVTAVSRPLAVVPVEPDQADPDPDLRLSRDDLLNRAAIDADQLADLEQFGLVVAEAEHYTGLDLKIARLAAALAEFGIEARHLRAFRASVDRELGLVEQVVAPMYRQRDPSARERADGVARDLAGMTAGLHAALVAAGLRRMTDR